MLSPCPRNNPLQNYQSINRNLRFYCLQGFCSRLDWVTGNRLVRAPSPNGGSGELNVEDYSRYFSTLLGGLAIQAANGVSKAEMKRTADMAVTDALAVNKK
jgi:hypothetical protein